jgi:vancomycin resistance protein YoaR
LFNAAFFAGLDIPAYKAHSKYISRYPFGREATLAYPSVDLKIRNNTPHGVVIWPTHTPTSITVDLWSTRYARGEQTAQNKSSGCGSVATERTRTFLDGRVEKDTFRANYDCD